MSATQNGVGGLTLGAPQTAAATYITIPSGMTIESIVLSKAAGDRQQEDLHDGDGAFHTSLWYERRVHNITIVMWGAAYTAEPGDMSQTNYEVMSVDSEYGKGVLRYTVVLRKIKFT